MIPQGTSAPAPGWTSAELAADPHANAEKPAKVRDMFAAIARSYDLNNRLHSLWRDQAWRRFAVRAAGVRASDDVLDMACGTGDLAQAFAAAGAHSVVGGDFTPQMLEVARAKAARLPGAARDRLRYVEADAQNLPFPDASFDVVSIAFGIRNVQDPLRALHEFRRVLRPGGRVVVLEFDRPRAAPVRWFNDFYCARVMPLTATLISRDRTGAYKYLPRSVGTFMSREQMLGSLAQAGFVQGVATPLTLGICVCYRGVVPG